LSNVHSSKAFEVAATDPARAGEIVTIEHGLTPDAVRTTIHERRCCQSNGNLSLSGRRMGALGSQLVPFRGSSRSVLLEYLPAVDMTFVVEMVVDRSVG